METDGRLYLTNIRVPGAVADRRNGATRECHHR